MKKSFSLILALALGALLMAAASAEDTGAYVLMNIPYQAFYAAEVTDASALDAVSSATKMKPRTGTLVGGSYHADPEGSQIDGVIFPVYVADPSVLAELGGREITDESSVEITVTNKGKESTTVYAGKDALFEAPNYSWYVLSETPAVYKVLQTGDRVAFSETHGESVKADANASFIYDKHADFVIKVSSLEDLLDDTAVNGVVLTAEYGTAVGLRHIANIWRGVQLGFNLDSAVYAQLKGKTLQSIRYLTEKGITSLDVHLPVVEDARLAALNGTYIELFPEFAKEEYKDFWMSCIQETLPDSDAAEAMYQALIGACMGTLRGQEAIDAYAANPEATVFDCFFGNGIARLKINGDVISGEDADGAVLFAHAYTYVDDVQITYSGQDIGVSLHIYQTEDADAGAFTFFAFADDTLKETQHIEFRYGQELAQIGAYDQGTCAYWLAAGTVEGYKESFLQDCIRLFVTENLAEDVEEEPAA